MIRKTLFIALTSLGLATSAFAAADPKPSVGIVNFNTCMTDSKLGKQEQASFESIKTQMTSLLEDTEKQLNELSTKFNDTEYMDGLTPDAEQDMQNKYRKLSEEMQHYQTQYYQILNQANMKIIQSMGENIKEASEKVAKDKKLSMVLNREACFFSTPTLDITSSVITEMDKNFGEKNAKTNEKEKK